MSDGWKLAVLKRRRDHLKDRIGRSSVKMAVRNDQRECDALDWAISQLDVEQHA
jgi:hypothetical protein